MNQFYLTIVFALFGILMLALAYHNYLCLKRLRKKYESLKGDYKRADGSVENLLRRIAWYRDKVSNMSYKLANALDRCEDLKRKDQALRLENWHLKNYGSASKGKIEVGIGDPRLILPDHEE